MPTPLVYILAASHSGSTLLTMLLNGHPDVATIGELGPGYLPDPNEYRCSCGSWMIECPFWRGIARQARARGHWFSLNEFGTRFRMSDSPLAMALLRPLHRRPWGERMRDMALRIFTSWPRRFREIAKHNETLAELIRDYYGAKVFVDKGNVGLRLKYLLRMAAFDVRVIRLIRDGRAVALTYTDEINYADATNPSLRRGGTGAADSILRLSVWEGARQWRRCNEEAENVLATVPKDRWIAVRYEELCAQTDTTLRRLCRFMGLDPGKIVPHFRSVEHHVIGNGMRLDRTSEVRLDERWRSVVTKQDLGKFSSVAGKMNQRYGYV